MVSFSSCCRQRTLSDLPSGWSAYQLACELRFSVSNRVVPSGLREREGEGRRGRVRL